MATENNADVDHMLQLAKGDGTLDTCVVVGRNDDDPEGRVKIFTPTADKASIVALLQRAIDRLGS